MPDLILEAAGLTKSYSRRPPLLQRLGRTPSPASRPALVDVSFSLQRGQTLGIVGESGSGKSTLARCVSLLERPDSGRVVFAGVELTSLTDRELRVHRRRIQIVFQDPYSSLNPRYSVRDHLAEVLLVHHLVARSTVDDRVRQLLDQVRLSTRTANRHPAEFSGGQRQRICIARALAAEPEVLIADEAVSSLDVSIQAQILNLLLDLREALGLTMLFISHNLHIVQHVAPRIAVMFGGRIVELLPESVSLDDARHPYTRALLAAAPRLARAEVRLRDEAAAELATALPVIGCPFRDRCPNAFEPCLTIDPEALAVADRHLVACHFVSPGPQARAS